MKLLRFKVTTPEGFRSLQSGFEIYFLRDFDYPLAHDSILLSWQVEMGVVSQIY